MQMNHSTSKDGPHLVPAVLYARVSSRDQEKEGYSIPAQKKLLRDYSLAHGFKVAKVFSDVETAKKAGRAGFTRMIAFLKENPSIKAALVEKTDRLSRKFRYRRSVFSTRTAFVEGFSFRKAIIRLKPFLPAFLAVSTSENSLTTLKP